MRAAGNGRRVGQIGGMTATNLNFRSAAPEWPDGQGSKTPRNCADVFARGRTARR
jgi:hypothetical protein